MRRNGARCTAAIVLLLGAFRLLGQEAAESYEQGTRLFRQGDLARAADSFRLALQKESRELEELRITSTYFIRPYVPHLNLGLCLVKSDPKMAREELLVSRRQGVAPRHSELAMKLERALADLDAHALAVTPTAPPLAATPAPIAVSALKPASPEAPGPAPTPAAPRETPARPQPGPSPTPTAAGRVLTAREKEALRLGVKQFFLCDYAEAPRTLEPLARVGDETARLFSAYALCATYLVRGEKEPHILADALAIYRGLPESVRQKARRGVSPRVLSLLERPPGLADPRRR